jgi:NADPH:quinone reductase-like Zn-dependent oxidoreductase
MQAVTLHEFGGPDVLRFGEHPDPEGPAGCVVVELRAAALNWHDCLVRSGQYDVPLPHVIGSDGAGVRRDTGDEVVILPSLRWGDDDRVPGPAWQILGDFTDGTYAELVSVPEENVFPKPRQWSWTDAAALPLAGLTAYRALFVCGRLLPGQTVLVIGAGGGVATFAIGLACMTGARVVVTSSSQEKLDRARELGASDGVLYTNEGWGEEVRMLTGGEGVDLIIDSAGSAWSEALVALRPGGRLVCFGATGSATAEVDLRRLYFGHHTIVGTTMGSPGDFAALLRTVQREPQWRPVVDRVVPLDHAADAHTAMECRDHVGKLVLSIR